MPKTSVHFDNIASFYDQELPAHVREFLLVKKTRLTVKSLKKYGISSGKGLDLGCGTGWYLKNISEYGYAMTGIDSSQLLIEEAKKNNKDNNAVLRTGDILNLEFEPESFDFAYCINSLHHLKDNQQLSQALLEVYRILKKGGVLIVHELNAFWLFRIYLNYLFPLRNKIDRLGGENWISPKTLLAQGLFEARGLYFYTFFPHLVPKSLFRPFVKVNSFMERITLRKAGLHYMAVLRKRQ